MILGTGSMSFMSILGHESFPGILHSRYQLQTQRRCGRGSRGGAKQRAGHPQAWLTSLTMLWAMLCHLLTAGRKFPFWDN